MNRMIVGFSGMIIYAICPPVVKRGLLGNALNIEFVDWENHRTKCWIQTSKP
jgi:hypothetical protein